MRLLYLPAYYEPEQFSGYYLNKNIIDAFLNDNENNEVIVYTPIPTRGIEKKIRLKYQKIKNEELYNGRLKVYRYNLPEEKNNTISIRGRGFENKSGLILSDFIDRLKNEIKTKKI